MKFISEYQVPRRLAQTVRGYTKISVTGILHPLNYDNSILLDELKQLISHQNKWFLFHLSCRETASSSDAYTELQSEILAEFDKNIPDFQPGHAISIVSPLLSFFNSCKSDDFSFVILLISDIHLLPFDEQYKLLSDLRNNREKSKLKNNAVALHVMVTGAFSYSKILDRCRMNSVSEVLEDRYYIGPASSKSSYRYFKRLYPNKIKGSVQFSILYELCGGSAFLMGLILTKRCPVSISGIPAMIETVKSKTDFAENVAVAYNQLSQKAKDIINDLARGRIIRMNSGSLLETLYLSSLAAVRHDRHYELRISNYLTMRILGENKIITAPHPDNISLLLPPLYKVNKIANMKIRHIENTLRNIVGYELGLYSGQDHPLKLLQGENFLKAVRNNGDKIPLYDWCIERSKMFVSEFEFNLYPSLLSHLELYDLGNIFFSKQLLPEAGNKPIKELFAKYFSDAQQMQLLLKKFPKLRNPVAHNQIVSYEYLIELKKVCDEIEDQLSIFS